MLALLQAAAEESATNGISLANGIAFVSTLLAAGAAGAAWKAAKATEDATRAQILSELAEEFWSHEYHEACRRLSDFFQNEGRWRKRWQRDVQRFRKFYEREQPSEPIAAVDRARRRVKGYYHRIWQLKRASLLDLEQVKEELSPERNLPILFRAVEPLECAVTEGYDPRGKGELYRFFAEKIYPDKEFRRPVLEEGCPSFSDQGFDNS